MEGRRGGETGSHLAARDLQSCGARRSIDPAQDPTCGAVVGLSNAAPDVRTSAGAAGAERARGARRGPGRAREERDGRPVARWVPLAKERARSAVRAREGAIWARLLSARGSEPVTSFGSARVEGLFHAETTGAAHHAPWRSLNSYRRATSVPRADGQKRRPASAVGRRPLALTRARKRAFRKARIRTRHAERKRTS